MRFQAEAEGEISSDESVQGGDLREKAKDTEQVKELKRELQKRVRKCEYMHANVFVQHEHVRILFFYFFSQNYLYKTATKTIVNMVTTRHDDKTDAEEAQRKQVAELRSQLLASQRKHQAEREKRELTEQSVREHVTYSCRLLVYRVSFSLQLASLHEKVKTCLPAVLPDTPVDLDDFVATVKTNVEKNLLKHYKELQVVAQKEADERVQKVKEEATERALAAHEKRLATETLLQTRIKQLKEELGVSSAPEKS